jgi:hypothetical protein
MELDPREARRGNPPDLIDDRGLIGASKRVHSRDRHQAIVRSARAFQDVLIVDDARESDEAGPGDTGAVELPHEP